MLKERRPTYFAVIVVMLQIGLFCSLWFTKDLAYVVPFTFVILLCERGRVNIPRSGKKQLLALVVWIICFGVAIHFRKLWNAANAAVDMCGLALL